MNIFDAIKKYLTAVTSAVSTLIVFLTDALRPPTIPDDFPESLADFSGKTKFIAGSVIILLILPLRRFSALKYRIGWWVACLMFFTAGVFFYNHYTNVSHEAVVQNEVAEDTVLIGTKLTPYAQLAVDSTLRKTPLVQITPEYLLRNYGEPKDIWTRDSIFDNAKGLFMSYSITVILLLLFMITGLQAAFGLQNKRYEKKI